MARTVKTESIVIKKRNLLNKDLLITFFTKDFGKLSAFAKGIRKITSRRAAHIQTANLIRALFHRKRDAWYLEGTQLVSGFVAIKSFPEKVRLLQFFFFLLDRLLPEGQKEEPIFSLTKSFLIDLSKKKNFGENGLLDYTHRMLFLLGYVKESRLDDPSLLRTIESIIDEKLPSFAI